MRRHALTFLFACLVGCPPALAADPVQVEVHSVKTRSTGTSVALVKVANNTPEMVRSVTIMCTFFGEGDEPLGTSATYAPNVRPSETVYAEAQYFPVRDEPAKRADCRQTGYR
jgi:hypothetical protein